MEEKPPKTRFGCQRSGDSDFTTSENMFQEPMCTRAASAKAKKGLCVMKGEHSRANPGDLTAGIQNEPEQCGSHKLICLTVGWGAAFIVCTESSFYKTYRSVLSARKVYLKQTYSQKLKKNVFFSFPPLLEMFS